MRFRKRRLVFCPLFFSVTESRTLEMLGFKEAHVYIHLECFRCKRQKANSNNLLSARGGGHWRAILDAAHNTHGLYPRENVQAAHQDDRLAFGASRSPNMDTRRWGSLEVTPEYVSTTRFSVGKKQRETNKE